MSTDEFDRGYPAGLERTHEIVAKAITALDRVEMCTDMDMSSEQSQSVVIDQQILTTIYEARR